MSRQSCYDCDRELDRRDLHMRPVIVTHDDGSGYDEVRVPLCPACEGQRFGFECPQCGILHDSKDDAEYCCRRRESEAPDCIECGRRMEVTSMGYSEHRGSSVTTAECECCPVMWGRYTGWDYTGDSRCKHVPTDTPGEQPA